MPARMGADKPTPRMVGAISSIAPGFDLILCDIWGVLHNGLVRSDAAFDALTRFRKGGSHVILVSNAPRPHVVIAEQLHSFGITSNAYDAILTSGDVTQGLIRLKPGVKLLHLGPERDLSLFEGLDAPLGGMDDSHYIVCTGLLNDETQTAADYADQLSALADKNLPMICANPDLVVDRGGLSVPCAGALGAAYEALGGQVIYPGKPHLPIYEEAMNMALTLSRKRVEKSRILAIGDAIRTDIAGGSSFGVATLMVLNGIHASEVAVLDAKARQGWFAAQEHVPDFVTADLSW